MNNDSLIRLSRAPGGAAWALTIVSCVLVAAGAATAHPLVLVLLAVCVPLALVAAVQVTAIAPLASEVLRLREELAKHGPHRSR